MLTLADLRHTYAVAIASPLLVLLLCFMEVKPMGCGQFRPYMAPLAGAAPRHDHESDLVISVHHEGFFYLGPLALRRDQLCDEVQQVLARNPHREIVLQVDRRSSFAGTRLVLQTLQHLGIRHVVLRSGNTE